MPTLSIAMIVKNEAGCLGHCLDSVRGVADEIVVCDTGSSDDTMAIARSYGARVLQIPWNDDFAEARNRSIAAVTGDWILHLDADEALDPEGAGRIRALVDADGGGADAIEVTLANYSNDMRAWRWVPVGDATPAAREYAGYVGVPLLRLFRNGRGFEYCEPVHENITRSVQERNGVIRHEAVLIHHYGYDPKPAKARAKAKLYMAIAREKVEARPSDPKAWYELAELSLGAGDTAVAEEACRKALALDPLHLNAASALANLLLNRGSFDEVRELLEGLEQEGVAPPHVITALGAVACRQGRLEEARRRLEAVVEASPGTIQAYLFLARTLDRLEDANRAEGLLASAVDQAPLLQELQDRLQAHQLRREGEREYGQGESNRALAILVDALRLDPEDPLIHNDLGVVLLTLGRRPEAKTSFERAVRLAPGLAAAQESLAALDVSVRKDETC
ncbi:MAG: tetratricopeptide repeat protein [Nitrospiraceae bacterium]|nr:tetratricopeptide repeat protein [Nitrospiraceae bacterium]